MLQCQHVVLWHEWRIQGLHGHLYQTSLRSCRAHLTVWTNAWFHPIFNNPGAHTHTLKRQSGNQTNRENRTLDIFKAALPEMQHTWEGFLAQPPRCPKFMHQVWDAIPYRSTTKGSIHILAALTLSGLDGATGNQQVTPQLPHQWAGSHEHTKKATAKKDKS